MKKVILNLLVLNLLALPCLLMFNDANPITGEWAYQYNIFGFVYSCWFYHTFLKPIFKPYVDEE